MKSPGAIRIFTAVIFTVAAIPLAWAQGDTAARVVRLSFVEGEVMMQRPDVQGWAEAPANTPLQQGFQLATGSNSYAEIEMENGSTVRLGEMARLDIMQLARAAGGGEINQVELRQGYATFHLLPARGENSLQVSTPYGTLQAQGEAEFRVDLEEGAERVEAFRGAVQVQGNQGTMTIEKDSVLVLQPGSPEPTVVSQGIGRDDWDQWVEDRENQMQPPGPSPDNYADDTSGTKYGWSDLLQYGSWSDVPGEGYGWSPSQVASGWAPYSTGQWCWYPGFGYTWIGAEPWGWLPYHYGGWDFIPGRGWVWFPNSLDIWSPSRVTWYHGPGWVGWLPSTHRKGGGIICSTNCGGSVVSTATFSHGGLLNPSTMLNISPYLGERLRTPGIAPTTAAKLTGPVVSEPAAPQQAFAGVRPGSPQSPNSTIVYDPGQNRYVNGYRVIQPQEPSASPSANNAQTTTAAKPGVIVPVPVSGRGQNGQAAENPATGYGNPYSFARQGPSGPRTVPSANDAPMNGRAGSAGTMGGGHVGGGAAPAAVHSAPAPAASAGSAGHH